MSSVDEIKLLCKTHHIVCLQETWLPVQKSGYLNEISNDHFVSACSSLNFENGILKVGHMVVWALFEGYFC